MPHFKHNVPTWERTIRVVAGFLLGGAREMVREHLLTHGHLAAGAPTSGG